jgi:TrmH family RNA methyltransferase
MTFIASRDNPRVRRWRGLTRDARVRRQQRSALIEGSNLISACLDSSTLIKNLIVSRTGSERTEFVALAKRSGKTPLVLADPVFRSIADTEAPAGIAAEIALPRSGPDLATSAGCVFLEGIQDAGNVGAILRSAAAFGIADAVLGHGCADAWSPKVLRGAMGAHFSMRIAENADLAVDIGRFGGTVVCTVPRGGVAISDADLAGRIGWIFGTEGQGVSDVLAARATLRVSIPMSGFAESLNVAAAAAICFYEAARASRRASRA